MQLNHQLADDKTATALASQNAIFGDFSRLARTPKKCYNGGYFEAARR
jgi:hypothetical protein